MPYRWFFPLHIFLITKLRVSYTYRFTSCNLDSFCFRIGDFKLPNSIYSSSGKSRINDQVFHLFSHEILHCDTFYLYCSQNTCGFIQLLKAYLPKTSGFTKISWEVCVWIHISTNILVLVTTISFSTVHSLSPFQCFLTGNLNLILNTQKRHIFPTW